jgi:hypothetical protein
MVTDEDPLSEKTLFQCHATNTNSILMGLGLNPRLRSETSVTNHLAYCTTLDV